MLDWGEPEVPIAHPLSAPLIVFAALRLGHVSGLQRVHRHVDLYPLVRRVGEYVPHCGVVLADVVDDDRLQVKTVYRIRIYAENSQVCYSKTKRIDLGRGLMSITARTAFEGVSLRGCICYAVMCGERVALAAKPDAKWRWVFDEFWRIAAVTNWEEWVDRVVDLVPCFVEELDAYGPAEFDWIDERQFEALKELYSDMPAALEAALHGAFDIEEHYAYSSVTDNAMAAKAVLGDILEEMERAGVEPPDPGSVSFSKLEGTGFGDPFDASALRLIE